mgnify:CR=1 FL=1
MKQPITQPDYEHLELPFLDITDIPELDDDFPALTDNDLAELDSIMTAEEAWEILKRNDR